MKFEFDRNLSNLRLMKIVPGTIHYHLQLREDREGHWGAVGSGFVPTSQEYFRVFVQDGNDLFKMTITQEVESEGANVTLYSETSSDHYLYYDGEKIKTVTKKEFDDFNTSNRQLQIKQRQMKNRLIWNNLHFFAIYFYPITATVAEKERAKKVLQLVQERAIDCGKCRQHFAKFIADYHLPLDQVVSTRESFRTLIQDLQNDVNRQRGEAQFTREQTDQYYENVERWNTELHQHGLTLYETFTEDKIDLYF